MVYTVFSRSIKRWMIPYILFSRNTVMAESSYFSRVPQEIICLFVNFLSNADKISLKLAYPDLYIEQK